MVCIVQAHAIHFNSKNIDGGQSEIQSWSVWIAIMAVVSSYILGGRFAGIRDVSMVAVLAFSLSQVILGWECENARTREYLDFQSAHTHDERGTLTNPLRMTGLHLQNSSNFPIHQQEQGPSSNKIEWFYGGLYTIFIHHFKDKNNHFPHSFWCHALRLCRHRHLKILSI
jgi:hypothetical protein